MSPIIHNRPLAEHFENRPFCSSQNSSYMAFSGLRRGRRPGGESAQDGDCSSRYFRYTGKAGRSGRSPDGWGCTARRSRGTSGQRGSQNQPLCTPGRSSMATPRWRRTSTFKTGQDARRESAAGGPLAAAAGGSCGVRPQLLRPVARDDRSQARCWASPPSGSTRTWSPSTALRAATRPCGGSSAGWKQARPLPFRRMECAPGEEAQVDFGTGAPLIVDGRRQRELTSSASC